MRCVWTVLCARLYAVRVSFAARCSFHTFCTASVVKWYDFRFGSATQHSILYQRYPIWVWCRAYRDLFGAYRFDYYTYSGHCVWPERVYMVETYALQPKQYTRFRFGFGRSFHSWCIFFYGLFVCHTPSNVEADALIRASSIHYIMLLLYAVSYAHWNLSLGHFSIWKRYTCCSLSFSRMRTRTCGQYEWFLLFLVCVCMMLGCVAGWPLLGPSHFAPQPTVVLCSHIQCMYVRLVLWWLHIGYAVQQHFQLSM